MFTVKIIHKIVWFIHMLVFSGNCTHVGFKILKNYNHNTQIMYSLIQKCTNRSRISEEKYKNHLQNY